MYCEPFMVMENDLLRFEYKGGEYVNVFAQGYATATDVINVFDYERGETKISTLADFREVVLSYWAEQIDVREGVYA